MTSSLLVQSLRRARDLADRCYEQPLDLATLAAAAGVSKYHFVRAFAETYGETPMRYLTRRRIDRAQDLLRNANLTVTEISSLVGFNSLGSFTSRFTTLVGVSPTRYRDRWAMSDGDRIPGCYLFMRGVDRWPEAGQPGPGNPEANNPRVSDPKESNLGEVADATTILRSAP